MENKEDCVIKERPPGPTLARYLLIVVMGQKVLVLVVVTVIHQVIFDVAVTIRPVRQIGGSAHTF